MNSNRLCALLVLVLALIGMAGCGPSAGPIPDQEQAEPTATSISLPTPTPPPTSAAETVLIVTATPSPPVPCAPSDHEQSDAVVIGALLPLSRPGAVLSGFAMQAALNVALEDVNEAGGIHGKPVRLISYDTAGIPSRGVHYAERLILDDCASAIVGLYHSNVGLAVKEVAHQYGIPAVFAETYSDEITEDHYREIFRIAPSRSMLAQMDANWLAEIGDHNLDGELTAALVVENSSYGRTKTETVMPYFAQRGIALESYLVDMPTRDFSPVIARIIELEMIPDAVFIRLSNGSVLDLHQQLLDAGIGPQNGTIIVSNWLALHDEIFWERVPDGLNAVATRIGAWPTTATDVGVQFAEDYREYFDRWPESYAFSAYDSLRLVADAMQRAASSDPGDIIDALETADVELASGRYYFPYGVESPPDGNEVPDYMWHQWPDVPLLYLQYTEPNQSADAMVVLWPELYGTVSDP